MLDTISNSSEFDKKDVKAQAVKLFTNLKAARKLYCSVTDVYGSKLSEKEEGLFWDAVEGISVQMESAIAVHKSFGVLYVLFGDKFLKSLGYEDMDAVIKVVS